MSKHLRSEGGVTSLDEQWEDRGSLAGIVYSTFLYANGDQLRELVDCLIHNASTLTLMKLRGVAITGGYCAVISSSAWQRAPIVPVLETSFRFLRMKDFLCGVERVCKAWRYASKQHGTGWSMSAWGGQYGIDVNDWHALVPRLRGVRELFLYVPCGTKSWPVLHLPRLTRLDIHRSVTQRVVLSLSTVLQGCPALAELSLGASADGCWQISMNELTLVAAQHTSIRTLKLTHVTSDFSSRTTMDAALSSFSNLTRLDLLRTYPLFSPDPSRSRGQPIFSGTAFAYLTQLRYLHLEKYVIDEIHLGCLGQLRELVYQPHGRINWKTLGGFPSLRALTLIVSGITLPERWDLFTNISTLCLQFSISLPLCSYNLPRNITCFRVQEHLIRPQTLAILSDSLRGNVFLLRLELPRQTLDHLLATEFNSTIETLTGLEHFSFGIGEENRLSSFRSNFPPRGASDVT